MGSFLRNEIRSELVESTNFNLCTISSTNCYKTAIKHLVNKVKELPIYGKADKNDFGNAADVIACLCAYNDKQYYLYKAISDPNKIGYLSRKQYRKLCLIDMDKTQREEFLAANGRMVTLYKLLARAVEENKYAKFLKVFKEQCVTLDEAKDYFESFAKTLHNSGTQALVEECSIQEAYDLPLRAIHEARYGGGSGERFAVTSCMEGNKCQQYYEAFGAKAYKVKVDGLWVGRFLVWETSKGKTYIDRLYCNARDAHEALAAIESKFGTGDDVVYYPCRIDQDDYVKCKDISKLGFNMFSPYVDSFFVFKYKENDKLCFLQQSNGSIVADFVHTSRHPPLVKICTCGAMLRNNSNDRLHEYICPHSELKLRHKKDFVRIYNMFKERHNEPLY